MVRFDYGRLIAPLAVSVGVSGIYTHAETTLEPIAPDDAVRPYLRDRQNELADATNDSSRYNLEQFVEWCEAEDVANLNSPRGVTVYRDGRRTDPRADSSESAAVRTLGAIVALIGLAGSLIFGRSFNGSETTVPTIIGILVAGLAIGWTLYRPLFSDGELLQ
jgi:hypothetical protein